MYKKLSINRKRNKQESTIATDSLLGKLYPEDYSLLIYGIPSTEYLTKQLNDKSLNKTIDK